AQQEQATDSPEFRLRGLEVKRLESFSDAVFGFALTLLVVSLDVPKTYADLVAMLRGFPAFAICFLFLVLIWHGHYKFCRRYGLEDTRTIVLTCLMLFLVLFFVYPLKFLFNLSIAAWSLGGGEVARSMTASQFATLLTVYGLGYAAVYGALCLLYAHAYRKRDELNLTEIERSETVYQMHRLLILVAVGLLAAAVAHIHALLLWSGMAYALIWPAMVIHRRLYFRGRPRAR
ncbi:MAG: TMEM175 family protein, partial [Verrucomicrobiota bacterium]|nr:TMEM175 family protein [Verrucomicrobiota bacterium]